MSYFVVATYYRDDAYGGPEEGGWWYSTYELDDVIGGAADEGEAWNIAQEFNDRLIDGQPRATVVELGRRELKAEYQASACHGEIGEFYDEETLELRPEYVEVRWDVPVFTPEHRPHYC